MTTDKVELVEAVKRAQEFLDVFKTHDGVAHIACDTDDLPHPCITLRKETVDVLNKAAHAHLATLTEPAPVVDVVSIQNIENGDYGTDEVSKTGNLDTMDAEAQEALQTLSDLEQCTSAGKLYPAAFAKIRRALQRSDMELPVLPDGWDYLSFDKYNGKWAAQIEYKNERWDNVVGVGDTPRAAVLAAIEKLEKNNDRAI